MQVATVFGRPDWDKIFTDIKEKHSGKRVGVFVCGPKVSSLHGGVDGARHVTGWPHSAFPSRVRSAPGRLLSTAIGR